MEESVKFKVSVNSIGEGRYVRLEIGVRSHLDE